MNQIKGEIETVKSMSTKETHTNKILLRVLLAGVAVLLLCGAAAGAVAADDSRTGWTKLTSSGGTLTAGTNYYLDGPVELITNLTIPSGNMVTIDLNGHVLKGTGSGSVITITSGGNLTLTDSSDPDTGKITGGKAELGGGVCNYGNFIMSGGNITGNEAVSGSNTSGGGGVYVANNCTFTMNGGAITDNMVTAVTSDSMHLSAYGGGVYVCMYGRFNMVDGEISGNKVTYTGSYPEDIQGGGVFVDLGTFSMSGGCITRNSSAKTGGGVCLGFSSANLTVTGDATIQENIGSDVDAGDPDSPGKVNLTGTLTGTVLVSFINSPFGTASASASGAERIINENTGYYGTITGENKLTWSSTAFSGTIITLDRNGGNEGAGRVAAFKDTTDSISIREPARTAFQFTGWYTEATGGTKIIDTAGCLVPNIDGYTKDGKWIYSNTTLTLYAGWKQTGTVITLNADQGSPAAQTVTAIRDVTASLSFTTPEKMGWSFAGWYPQGSSDIKLIDEEGNLKENIAPYTGENGIWIYDKPTLTLNAKWDVAIKINLNPEGGSGSIQAVYAHKNKTTSFAITPPEKTGYVFTGWYLNATPIENEKIIDTAGKLVPGVGGYTDAKGVWISGNPATFHAGWALEAPVISGDASTTYGTGVTLTASTQAAASSLLSYQWYEGTDPISGAASETCEVPEKTSAGDHTYKVKITDAAGITAESNGFTVTVHQKEVTVTWDSESSVTYDGSDHTPTAAVNNPVDGDNVSVTVAVTRGGSAVTEVTDAGDYIAAAAGLSGTDAGNYTLPETRPTCNLTISRLTASLSWTPNPAAFEYDGDSHVPTAAVSNKAGTDDVSVTVTGGGTDAGTYTAAATGFTGADAGNYMLPDTPETTFSITAKPLSGCTVEPIPDRTYTGSPAEPAVTVKDGSTSLVKDTDYTVACSGSTGVGTATVTITGTGNYTGTKSVNFTITPRSLSDGAAITLAKNSLRYTGSEQTVTITSVTDDLGNILTPGADKDYTINTGTDKGTDIGSYTVKITGCGNYKDEASVGWSIVAGETIITLAPNGGTGGPASTDVTYGQPMPALAAADLPTRVGYTFTGYYDATAGGKQYYDSLGSGAAVWDKTDDSATLYAQWTVNTYTVAFNPNGGSGTMAPQPFTYGTAQNLTANSFKKNGYAFDGWDTNSAGTTVVYADGASVSNLTTEAGRTVTLYAVWRGIATPITPGPDGHADIGIQPVPRHPENPVEIVSAENVGSMTVTPAADVDDPVSSGGFTLGKIYTLYQMEAAPADPNKPVMITIKIQLSAGEKPESIYLKHYNETAGKWDSGYIVPEKTPVLQGGWREFVFPVTEFSPFAVVYETPVKSGSGSSTPQGSSVWLTEPVQPAAEQPTVTPTPTPGPVDAPTVKPVNPSGSSAKTPAPFLGILAGLGAAAAVFGLRRK